MADHTTPNDGLSTQADTRIGTPIPKTETLNSGEAITRVNSSEKKISSEKETTVTPAADAAPSTLLTGRKLALAHIGFLL